MSKEEMTQFSLIIKESIKESNKSLTQEIVLIKDDLKVINTRLDGIEQDVKVLKLDMIEVKADIKAMKNTPTMKKELGL